MSSLRSRLIHLAHEHPHFRPDLLPLLKEAAEEHQEITFRIFQITTLQKYLSAMPSIQEGLERAEKDFAQAGFPLKGIVRIKVMGKGRAERSFFQTPTNFIQILPVVFNTGVVNYVTFIHELAHWYHWNRVPGGFNNKDIFGKFVEARGSSPTHAKPVSEFDFLQQEIEVLKKKEAELLRSVSKGSVVEIEDWNDPYRKDVRVTRKYRIIKPVPGSKGRYTETELLTPSSWDLQIAQSQGWKPPYIKHIFTKDLVRAIPGLDESVSKVQGELQDRYEKSNAIATAIHNDPTLRYEKREEEYAKGVGEWMPTEYARTNHKEWFAELVTNRIVKPSNLSQPVKDWLRQF